MLPNPSARETRPLIPVHAALFLGFIITGMACTILGPTLPIFIARWNLSDAQAGFFFTTQFGGSLLGVITSGVLLSTRGYRAALILGFFLMAAGIAGLDSASHLLALLATAAYGFGFGVAIPATNLCVAEISGERRSAALNLLNIGWSVGAITCPVIMLAGLRSNRFTQALFAISLGAVVLAVLFWMMKFENTSQSIPSHGEAVSHHRPIHPIHIPVALALLFYLYVGTENGISGWAAEQARRIGFGASSTIIPMFFWAGLLSGRGISVIMLHRTKEILVVISGLLLSALGTVVLLLAATRSHVILGVLVAGLGLSSLYPVFIAWLSKWYGARARSLGAVMFSLAAIGGATVPWIVGFVSQRAGSLRVGLLVPLAGCLSMIIVVAVLRRRIVA
jgi:FHS family glucose/mannose:H+ symporter-like MFS transporter